MMDWNKRGTGRTARMLKEALAYARCGKKVHVVGLDGQHCNGLCVAALKVVPEQELHSVRSRERVIHYKNGGSIHFAPATSPIWEWNNMRLLGTPSEERIFIDHYALLEFAEQFHRFDDAEIFESNPEIERENK